MRGQGRWPEWWEWEIELTPHVERRMADRGVNEVDIRRMLAIARRYRRDPSPGRWVIETHHKLQPWEVIVEPDATERKLVVVTAYCVEESR